MSKIDNYPSEKELRELISENEEMMEHFRQMQAEIDRERGELADDVQAALATYEAAANRYEEERDGLDDREAQLRDQRQPFLEDRERFEVQLAARREAREVRPDNKQPMQEPSQQTEQPEPKLWTGPVHKDDIERLKSQLPDPDLDATFDPPSLGPSGKDLDADLKRMADELRQKEALFHDRQSKIRHDWNQANKPKR